MTPATSAATGFSLGVEELEDRTAPERFLMGELPLGPINYDETL